MNERRLHVVGAQKKTFRIVQQRGPLSGGADVRFPRQLRHSGVAVNDNIAAVRFICHRTTDG